MVVFSSGVYCRRRLRQETDLYRNFLDIDFEFGFGFIVAFDTRLCISFSIPLDLKS